MHFFAAELISALRLQRLCCGWLRKQAAVLRRSVNAAPDWVLCTLKTDCERASISAQLWLGKLAWGNSLHLK